MNSATGVAQKLQSSTSAQPCRRFSLAEIQSSTKYFDDELVIGHGGFGKVYKGHICIGETSLVVAIKRLDSMSDQGAPEFRAEIEMLSNLRHCHLVSLIGYCDDNKEMILVYEYMPHGTLNDHLHKTDTPLNWVQRLKIAIGAARGLDYLHTGVGTQHGIIHRDVKSSNILLDENWAAMISDFGLSRVGPTNQPSSFLTASVKGTFGYLDPEYFLTSRLTRKTDVFAFGVVLFELLSGRRAVDIRYGEEECSLVRWAQKCVRERRLDELVDPTIRGTVFPKSLRQFARIADRCLHSFVQKRPTMTEVVASLQLLLTLQEKYDNSTGSSALMGFTSMMQKYFSFQTKVNSDHIGTNIPKSSTDNSNRLPLTKEDADDHQETPHQRGEIKDLKVYTYSELECATERFQYQRYLGGGTYKGWVDELTYAPSELDAGLAVVIRRSYDYDSENPEEFEDMNMLKGFNHPNLVKLIGYCLENKVLFLVYEFLHNGNLEDCLREGVVAQLPLVTRVKIALGIARGISFVSTEYKIRESQFERLHIFLDENFTAKLSTYDLMKMLGRYKVDGGFESFDLRNNNDGFAVVFAEVLSGKQLHSKDDFQKMNDLLLKLHLTKSPDSLRSVAKYCFDICNEEGSESKMLTLLNKFDGFISHQVRAHDEAVH